MLVHSPGLDRAADAGPRPGRGLHPGRLRPGLEDLAGRNPGKPRRLAHHGRPATRAGPAPAGDDAAAEASAADRGPHRARGAADRSSPPRVHLLPPRARPGLAGGVDPAADLRSHHPRGGGRAADQRGDRGRADHPGEEEDRSSGYPVPDPGRRRAVRATGRSTDCGAVGLHGRACRGWARVDPGRSDRPGARAGRVAGAADADRAGTSSPAGVAADDAGTRAMRESAKTASWCCSRIRIARAGMCDCWPRECRERRRHCSKGTGGSPCRLRLPGCM